jgi:hypothetical protein
VITIDSLRRNSNTVYTDNALFFDAPKLGWERMFFGIR